MRNVHPWPAEAANRRSVGTAVVRGTAVGWLVILFGAAPTSGADKAAARPTTRPVGPSAYAEYLERGGRPMLLDGERPARPAQTADKVPAEQHLARPLRDLGFDGTGLQDVIDVLRDETGAEIFVNWRALEAAGVKRDLPITLRIANAATLAESLGLVLRRAGGERVPLGWTTDEGMISISTGEDLSKNVMTRVYDVRHLVRREHHQADTAAAIRRVQGLDPLSYREYGGHVGTVRELSGQLVITHNPEMHGRIAVLLAPPGPATRPATAAGAGDGIPSPPAIRVRNTRNTRKSKPPPPASLPSFDD